MIASHRLLFSSTFNQNEVNQTCKLCYVAHKQGNISCLCIQVLKKSIKKIQNNPALYDIVNDFLNNLVNITHLV